MSFEPKDNKTAKIHGHSVSVPCPYTEGHTLTASEAEALNSHFVDGVRARVASQVKDVEDVYTRFRRLSSKQRLTIPSVSAAVVLLIRSRLRP